MKTRVRFGIRTGSWIFPNAAVFVFYIGLAPGLFFKLIDPSVEKLVGDFKQRNTVEQKVAAQPAPPAVAAVVVPAEPVNN